ncbi:MAG: TRAM domain-containing protein, partial [Clostridia bacterium]|nr:TRAM domain-containing protein [Clostridia bacterium]
ARLIALSDTMRQAFFASCAGKEERVLLESTRKDGDSFGYTANYTPVLVRTDAPQGSLIDVRITGAASDAVLAEVIE